MDDGVSEVPGPRGCLLTALDVLGYFWRSDKSLPVEARKMSWL
jgi:hypothetical protein